jgi:hypothetical protein
VTKDLVKGPVRELAIELLRTRVCVLPVKVTPSGNLRFHLFCHCLGLRSVGDHCVDFACGSLAELEEQWGVGLKSDSIKEISKGELCNGPLVRRIAQDF